MLTELTPYALANEEGGGVGAAAGNFSQVNHWRAEEDVDQRCFKL